MRLDGSAMDKKKWKALEPPDPKMNGVGCDNKNSRSYCAPISTSSSSSLATLVRDAFDPEKPSRFDHLTTTLNSSDASDEDVALLFRLMQVDEGVGAALKAADKKRFVDALIKCKWSERGELMGVPI